VDYAVNIQCYLKRRRRHSVQPDDDAGYLALQPMNRAVRSLGSPPLGDLLPGSRHMVLPASLPWLDRSAARRGHARAAASGLSG
jgi:hypothetical protein